MSDAQPLVTIAIPTYNRADNYLPQSLESAIRQTYRNIEIVVSDNCSTDNTETVVKDFADARIKYFKQTENIGLFRNWNFCLEQAAGDFFLMLSDDDLIDEDFVEVCLKALNGKTDVGVIRTSMRRIDGQGQVVGESLNQVDGLSLTDFFLAWFEGKTPMHACHALINTRRLREVGGYQPKHRNFLDVAAQLKATQFGRVDIAEVKASFRQHASQAGVAAKVNLWCEDSLILLDAMCDLAPGEKKAMVRREGMRFFAKHNYRLAKKIPSPIERIQVYFWIFKFFDYQYSPLHFFAFESLRRLRRTKSKVRGKLSNVGAFAFVKA